MEPNQVGRLITFSGIDGAGKSTQIAALQTALSERGLRIARIAFWEDAAILPRFRAGVSLKILRGKQERRQSSALRSDKNVRAWYLTLIRSGFYLLDALHLRRVVARLQRTGADFIILDRCSYDQLVHIRSRHWLARAYIRTVMSVTPTPDFAFVLDASPEEAFRRKPEYPLAFMREYRHAFLGLREFVPHLAVIAPAPVEEVHQQIIEHLTSGGANYVSRASANKERAGNSSVIPRRAN
jgi:thymidylate kinase